MTDDQLDAIEKRARARLDSMRFKGGFDKDSADVLALVAAVRERDARIAAALAILDNCDERHEHE